MSANTKIEYLSKTWNPVAMRDHCWHLSMAARHAGCRQLPEPLRRARAGGKPWLNETELLAPLRWKKPQRVGVQFMGDLFHAAVPVEMVDRVFDVMWKCHQHTFLVLTKRPERLTEYVRDRAYKQSFGWTDRGRSPMAPGYVTHHETMYYRDECGYRGDGDWCCSHPANEERCIREDSDNERDDMIRVGKAAAGRKLDGREWNEMPEAAR